MPQTHDAGPFFWHKIRLRKDTPRHHRYATYEYEYPNRVSYAHVIRLLGRWGIALGRWHSKLDADVAEMEAVKGRFERGDVLGEGGVSIEDHRKQAYERAQAENDRDPRFYGRPDEELRTYNGWTVV